MFGKIPFDRENHNSVILQRLNEMRKTKVHCDFVLKIGCEEIEAHRNILSAGSDYFAAMLSHDTKENQTGIADIKEADPSCVRRCIDLIYTGIPPDLNDNIEQLMYTAHLLQLTSLCKGIWKVLEKELRLETFFQTRILANLYCCKNLVKKCKGFALVNFEAISKLEEFGQLDKSFIERMMASKSVVILDESKLDAILRWVKCDLKKKTKFLNSMLKCVSLSEVPSSYLRHLIENEPLINSNVDRLKLFSISALDNVAVKPKSLEKTETEDAIAVFDHTSGYLQSFNPAENNWAQIHKMNVCMRKKWFTSVSVNEYIYVFLQDKSVHRLRYLDKITKWERVGNMIDDHGTFPPCVVLKNNIYIVGGCGCLSKSVEMFDFVSNKWFKLADKRKETNGSQPVVLNGKIYCCGGFADGQYTNVVECFNPDDSTWINKAPMSETKLYVSAVVYDDKLYVLGGNNGNGLGTVECYDPGSNKWYFLKPMNKPRYGFRSFVMKGNIYAVGDYNSRNSIEKYDIGKNEWENVAVLDSINLYIKESVKIKLRF